MRLIFKSFLLSAIAVLVFESCSHSSKLNNGGTAADLPNVKMDTSILAYNPRNADRRIAEVMEKLHKTRGFNGNVLVAKHGKYSTKKQLAGPITCTATALNSVIISSWHLYQKPSPQQPF